jgi:sugar (pentulose or hexulose) kinase
MSERGYMETELCVIGLDSSTTATKAIAWNEKGEVLASAREPIPLDSPRPHYFEQDPDDWWNSTWKALQAVTRQVNPGTIKAVAISNQRETFVPLDNEYRCLRPAIVWLDERCKDEVSRFAREIGRKRIHRITGKPVDYAPVVYRLAWMKRHEPGLFRKIQMICDVHTYLVWKLTGVFKTSRASADPLGLYDLGKGKWSQRILSALELTEDHLPATYPPGAVLGTLSREVAARTGLTEKTLVVAGGGDGQAAGTGVNALSSRRAYLNLGTAVVCGVYGNRYRMSKAYRTLNSCSDTGYYYECSLRAGTFAIDWFIKNILRIDPAKESGIYQKMEQEAVSIPPGSDNLLHLPYLCGVMNPYWDSDARAAFIGLSPVHTRAHMYRALLEGIAFELLFTIRLVEKSINKTVQELAAIGGGTSSNLWCRMIADVTGKKICLPATTEASCLGAGIAASVGARLHPAFRQAAETMTGYKQIIEPDLEQHRIYQSFFTVYKRMYHSLKDLR